MKDKTTALLLSVLLGGLGVDRFYLGYTGMGVLKLLTGGCFGVLYILDIINIATGKLMPADGTNYANDIMQGKNMTQCAKNSDPYEGLKKLAALHEQGVLNDDEFNKLKQDILSKL